MKGTSEKKKKDSENKLYLIRLTIETEYVGKVDESTWGFKVFSHRYTTLYYGHVVALVKV